MHSFLSWPFSVLLSLSFLHLSYLDINYENILHFTANINSSVVFSCGPANVDLNWVHKWFANEQPLEEIVGYRTVLSNGSLSIRVRMEDSDIMYVCEVTGRFANGSEAVNDVYVFKVDPIVAAFLSATVENVTLDWGTIYTFPCGFAGTLPREQTMLLNHKVVTERYHNITENSVVECVVRNEAGSEHGIAYISLTPGSKEWALDHGVPTSSYCQPYSATIRQPSICTPYLDDAQPHSRKAVYLVARSRLYTANITESSLTLLFSAWDELLIREQFSRLLTGNSTSWNKSEPIQMSYAAVRCVELAKRLACVLAYPKCEPLTTKSSFDLFPNEFHREHPVCQSHCLAVSGLFCTPTLDVDELTSSLDPLLFGDPEAEKSYPLITGWSQLTQVPEIKLPGLPSSFSTLEHKHPGSDVLKLCGALGDDGQSFISASQSECAPFSLEDPLRIPQKFTNRQFNVHVPEDHSTDRCVSGDGRSYRGSETSAGCHPWDAVGHLLFSGGTADSVTWPALVALNPHSFPTILGDAIGSTSFCRNPAGLARAPFCIGSAMKALPVINETVTTESGKLSWHIILCSELPHCLNLSASSLWNSVDALSDESAAVALSTVKIQVTVACVLLVCLLCIISVISVIWRSHRCGALYSINSDLSFSGLDDKDSAPDSADALKSDKCSAKGFTDAPEQLYVKHRLQWVRRRRRLRQLHPTLQPFLHCWFVFSDWITCNSSHSEPSPRVYIVPSVSSGGVSFNASVTKTRDRTSKPVFPYPACCLSLLPATTQSRIKRDHSTNKRKHSTEHRSHPPWSTKPLSHGDDDEFESNALRMQLQKSVTHVANVSVSPTPSSLVPVTNMNLGSCKNCELVEKLSHSPFSACYTECVSGGKKRSTIDDAKVGHAHLHVSSEILPLHSDEQDPGSALTKSSLQLINANPTDFGSTIIPEKLFNMASMTHLLHPNLKQLCYPRSRLLEIKRLAKRSFGWVVLARAPDMHNLIRRHRLVSVTSSDWHGLSDGSQSATTEVTLGDCDSPLDTSDRDLPYVVVKTLTVDASMEIEANFLREAEVLVELSHRNIIRLLGICLPLQPLSLLLEYMPFGDLNSFLRHYQHPTEANQIYPLHLRDSLLAVMNGEVASSVPSETETVYPTVTELHGECKQLWLPPTNLLCTHLLGFARDACEAMAYLSNNYYVHRDVATRSFLVGNKMVVKLADFFMCRPIQPDVDFIAAEDIYLPIRWLPLESILNGLFHVDTDVWSFGVFLWELFTYASEPYADMSHAEVIGFLEAGGRLSCPSGCPPEVYELMTSCWNAKRGERPSFNAIRLHLQRIVSRLPHPV